MTAPARLRLTPLAQRVLTDVARVFAVELVDVRRRRPPAREKPRTEQIRLPGASA
jgi:hypothetical protein